MSASRRTQRIAALIRAELANLVLGEVSDPTLHGLVITDVQMTADLKIARVFYTNSVESVKPKDIEKGISRAMPFFRHKLADNLDLRYVPTLQFIVDEHGNSVNRLYHLFDSVERENKSRNEEDFPQ